MVIHGPSQGGGHLVHRWLVAARDEGDRDAEALRTADQGFCTVDG